jgi:hypothetical protein
MEFPSANIDQGEIGPASGSVSFQEGKHPVTF